MQKASRGKGCDLFFNMATGDLSVPARLIVVWIQNTESLSLTERFLTIIGVYFRCVGRLQENWLFLLSNYVVYVLVNNVLEFLFICLCVK